MEQQTAYVVDTRPLCQGKPFVLTDSAHPLLVLKHGTHYMVLDLKGSIPSCNSLRYGYYRNDTRYLSQCEMTLDGVELSLLSFDIKKGYAGSFLYTNPQTAEIQQQMVMVSREILLSEFVREKIVIENYSSTRINTELSVKFQSDFAVMFEVRGLNQSMRGFRMMPIFDLNVGKLYLAYKGANDCLLETIIEFRGKVPDEILDGEARFKLDLAPKSKTELEYLLLTRAHDCPPFFFEDTGLESALAEADKEFELWRSAGAGLSTSHEILNMGAKGNA